MMGLDDVDKSMVMALAVASGMLAQFPAGWLADHMDRGRLLSLLTACATLAAVLPLVSNHASVLFVFAIAYGAATFPLYAVGVARTSEVLDQTERTSAAAMMIVAFNVGAVVAPLALSNATAALGSQAYFLLLSIPQAAFAIAASSRRKPGTTQA
jgi:MFS family permease